MKLYPSIPRKEGLAACEKALNSRKKKELPTKDILQMIELVLEGNNFRLLDKNYLQKEGVAIGSKLGRNFACTYMREWDKELLNYSQKPLFYKRFIDDGFGIWVHGKEKLMKFYEHANSINPNIKVELRWNYKTIDFLDTTVRIENGRISTDLFTKPTDKHIYVHSKSCHPRNVKKSIPYGLGLRLKRICSNEEDYKKHRNELKKQLRKRGYNGKFIEGQLKKADSLNRKDLLRYTNNNKEKSKRVPLVVTYSDLLPDIHKIVRERMEILHQSEEMKEIFKEQPIVAFRRDRNLSDILVHGKLNKISKSMSKGESNRCNETMCEICDIMRNDTSISIEGTTKPYVLKETIHGCQLKNIIYGLHCDKCEKYVYVGETERTLAVRTKEHLADIRRNRDTTIAEHFNKPYHSGQDLTVQILQQVYDKSSIYRKNVESKWIQRLNTMKPFGANIQE